MKTPEERAERILETMAPWAPHGPGWETPEAAIVRHINEAIAESAPKWISATERLPEATKTTDMIFLAVTIYQTVDPVRFNPKLGIFEYLDGDDYCDAEATHWMAMPEPPREATNE